jgi:hypothetical protein
MDQLRKAWGWLQRQHFWVLTAVAVLVALGCWWRGANALLAEYTKNRGAIESQFTEAENVRKKEYHPNADIQAKQTEEIANQQKSVRELWEQLYARQTAAVLKWPGNLSEEFRKYIEKLTFGDEIRRDLRAHYNNYIQNHFPALPKIVGALEAPADGQGGMGSYGRGGSSFDLQSLMSGRSGRGRGGPEGGVEGVVDEPDFIVIWADQQLIRDELAPRTTPSAKRIWKTQEDLWVYEALLQIIANTNQAAHADRFSNAAVRVIQSLEVGRAAAQASRGTGRIDMIVSGATSEGSDPRQEGGSAAYGSGERGGREAVMSEGYFAGGERGGRGGVTADDDLDLFNNRYVGADGVPIPDPGDGNPTAFGTEFKRLPVRMTLTMDGRWLPQLIAECANAPLQVEVQEVRINPEEGGGSMGGGRGGRGGGYGMSTSLEGQEMVPEAEPNVKTVILQGIVYIFNPPTDTAADASGQVAGVQ